MSKKLKYIEREFTEKEKQQLMMEEEKAKYIKMVAESKQLRQKEYIEKWIEFDFIELRLKAQEQYEDLTREFTKSDILHKELQAKLKHNKKKVLKEFDDIVKQIDDEVINKEEALNGVMRCMRK